MKKLFQSFIIFIMFLVVGCSNVEQTIFQSLNDDIEKQNGCNTENSKLSQQINEEADLYNQIIEKGTESFSDIQNLIDEAKVNVQSTKVLLDSYEICIKDASSDTQKLKDAAVKIKDEEVKSETLILIEQYNAYATSLVDYVDGLKKLNESQNVFYSELTEELPLTEVEQLVFNINEDIENTNKASDVHKETQTTFNLLYSDYYEKYYAKTKK
ncbi:MAG: YkyA family protein [Turicibacter sp.]